MISPTLKLELSQLEADFCSALSDPTRLLILYALGEGARNVNDLAGELAIPQPTASRHLKVLRDRGLVWTTRQGTSVTYQLADAHIGSHRPAPQDHGRTARLPRRFGGRNDRRINFSQQDSLDGE